MPYEAGGISTGAGTEGAAPGAERVPNQVIATPPIAKSETRNDNSQPMQGIKPRKPVTSTSMSVPNPVKRTGAQV